MGKIPPQLKGYQFKKGQAPSKGAAQPVIAQPGMNKSTKTVHSSHRAKASPMGGQSANETP